MTSKPQAGDFFTVKTGGRVGAIIRLLTHAPVNHAGIYLGNGRIIEAEPGGARLALASKYPHAVWHTAPPGKGLQIAQVARRLVGTPYNTVDIAVIAAVLVLGWHVPTPVKRRLQRPDRLICSQLVDYAYQQAGVNLFSDGRPAFLVTPGDLYRLDHGTQ